MIVNTSTNPVTAITTILASVGAINWGLIATFDLNLVSYLFGEASFVTKIVYMLVGASGLYLLLFLSRAIFSPAVKDIS